MSRVVEKGGYRVVDIIFCEGSEGFISVEGAAFERRWGVRRMWTEKEGAAGILSVFGPL